MKRQLDLWGDETPDSALQPNAHESLPNPELDETQASTKSSAHQVLTKPDRQVTFEDVPHSEWPAPSHDRDTISVDRHRDKIDGPAHRFVIKRHDFVEVYSAEDRVDYGTVIGISHARDEVRVRFDGGDDGAWFPVDSIYPAVPGSNKTELPKKGNEIRELVKQMSDTAAKRVKSMRNYTSLKCIKLVRTGSLEGRPKLTSTKEAINFFAKYWEDNPANDQELFVVANLDTKHRVQSVVVVTIGTLDASLVHPREVFKSAFIEGSSAIIISHNHPSGDPAPSREDHEVTNRLTEVGKLIGINVLDHIVHGDGTNELISIRES